MKLALNLFLINLCSVSAFTVTTQSSKPTQLAMAKNDGAEDGQLSRRQTISNIFTSATAATMLSFPSISNAAREPLPEYLTEPTEAFKESERQRDEFRRAQLALKKKFLIVLDRLTFESSSEEDIIRDLKELQELVITTEGLPMGIKKDEVIKIIRAKKAKGFWPTPVEYQYQALTREIAYQQSPNREKDTANPL